MKKKRKNWKDKKKKIEKKKREKDEKKKKNCQKLSREYEFAKVCISCEVKK